MDAKWAAILINFTPSYNGRQMNIFEKKNKKNMSKLIYFKGICTLSIVWEAGPVVLSNCKNMLCINWNNDIDTTFWIRHTNLWATRKTLRPFWDCYSIQPKRQNVCYWWRWNRRPVDHPNDRCFSIHHALQEGNKLSPSVFLEKRKSLGTEHIYGIMPYKICIFRIYASKALGGL
jgi:hypothetical protein